MTDAAPPQPSGAGSDAARSLIVEHFGEAAVTRLRHAVASCAGEVGLAGERLDDFVLAVNELLTNAVRHGGGQGRLRLWREGGDLVCEVSDAGAGLDPRATDRSDRPALDTPGGWGLWLVARLTDDMQVRTGADGTLVRVSSAIGGAAARAAGTPSTSRTGG